MYVRRKGVIIITSNQINYWNFHEGRRHNKATEKETHRHNVVTEGIERSKVALGHAQLEETKVRNQNDLLLGSRNADISEKRAEYEHTDRNIVSTETSRHNVSMEEETQRHNLESELISGGQNLLRSEELELAKDRHSLEKKEFVWEILSDALLGKQNIWQAIGTIQDNRFKLADKILKLINSEG